MAKQRKSHMKDKWLLQVGMLMAGTKVELLTPKKKRNPKSKN